MSILESSINEGEQAGEKLTDHAADRIEKDTPGVFRQLLDIFAEYEFYLGLRKRQ